MRASTLALAGLLLAAVGDAVVLLPDRYCLACLCNAASNCSPRIGCRPHRGRFRCGPFLLTAGQWRRARAAGGVYAKRFRYLNFRSCANDAECAAETLSQYLSTSATDCDGDGRITCKDFGVMAHEGADACKDRSAVLRMMKGGYFRRLEGCLMDLTEMLLEPPLGSSCGYAA